MNYKRNDRRLSNCFITSHANTVSSQSFLIVTHIAKCYGDLYHLNVSQIKILTPYVFIKWKKKNPFLYILRILWASKIHIILKDKKKLKGWYNSTKLYLLGIWHLNRLDGLAVLCVRWGFLVLLFLFSFYIKYFFGFTFLKFNIYLPSTVHNTQQGI